MRMNTKKFECNGNCLRCGHYICSENDFEEDILNKMKIAEVTETAIIFDNGNEITYHHRQDCCEDNYADFSILNENVIWYDHEFPEDLQFKYVEGEGFCFGEEGYWIFIPCYSDQNGYYSYDIDIYYNDVPVLSGECASAPVIMRY